MQKQKQDIEDTAEAVYNGKIILDGSIKTLTKLLTSEIISSLKFVLTDDLGVQDWTLEGWTEEDITALQAVIATIMFDAIHPVPIAERVSDAVNTFSMIVDKRIEKRTKEPQPTKSQKYEQGLAAK